MAKNLYINAYHDSVLISSGDGTAPLNVGPLNAANNELSAAIPLEIKAEPGFKAIGTTAVSFEGTSASKWTLCATEAGTYTATLNIASEITITGTIIYVKAIATSDETPSNDTSVDIKIATIIAAV